MRAYFPSAVLVLSSMAAACTNHSGFEKTYLSEGGNYVIMLQLRSDDGRILTGSVISTSVGEDWNVSAANKPISGTIEGGAVNFTINHPPGNSPAVTPVSGIVSGGNLDLTLFANGQATSLKFKEGSAERYQAAVSEMFNAVAEFS